MSKKVQANAVFACFDHELIEQLQEKYFFYVWDKSTSEVRWMTSFATTEQEILEFVATIQEKVTITLMHAR